MDSSTLLRRTPAGDDEVARPANGLSITQRRILTLLDAPGRLGELPLGSGIDGERVEREATRLARAGLIVCERQASAREAIAANAPELRRPGMSFARTIGAAAMLAIVGAVVWVGWQFSAPPSTTDVPRASASGKARPVTTTAMPAPADPAVFATRVLRSDPRPPAPLPKAAAETATAPVPSTPAASRAEP